MADIEIEIDGKCLTAKPNQTIIQVADEANIYIPRFCYHQHLSIPANCRMCLVEVEKSPKVVPACSTPAAAGMKIFTKSEKTLQAQRAVMEFLLINHPLDCPICDQGGECELQDLSMGYGSSHSQYTENKRAVPDQDLGPLIATEMTRCIYCTRCIRFGEEVAGVRELGLIGRGEFTEVSTYIQHFIHSEVSGNIIDLCPVGALTSKPFRFRARAWELQQAPSISPHDCLGTNLNVHTLNGRVMRVVARENKEINKTWLSDRDRFSYTGLYHPDRFEEPIARINGNWEVVDWSKALEIAAAELQSIISEHGSDKLGALASPNSTLEEFYLLQKIIRALGSMHIDHRLREVNTKDQANMPYYPKLNISLAELSQCDAILLVGSNIQHEQPLAGLRIREASLTGAKIAVINSIDVPFNFTVHAKEIISPQYMVQKLAALAKALGATDLDEFSQLEVDTNINLIAQQLLNKQKVSILLGALIAYHPQADSIRYLVQKIAELTKATFGWLTEGANAAGAWLAGAVPHRHADGSTIHAPGLSAYEMLEKHRKAYLLMNVEPDLDCANSYHAIEALKQAKFVMSLSTFRNPILEKYAHVILPMAPFTETSGTFVNIHGKWQSFTSVAQVYRASRPGWKILRTLANFLNLEGFDYTTSEQVCDEIKLLTDKFSDSQFQFSKPEKFSLGLKTASLVRIGEIPMYAVDPLVRRAAPLQATPSAFKHAKPVIRIHPETASRLKLADGEKVWIKQHSQQVQLIVLFDARVAKDAALAAGGIPATTGLGDLVGEITIESLKK